MDPELDQQGVDATGDDGLSVDFDPSSFGIEQVEEVTTPQTQATATEIADNPKWSKFLEAIPGAFHNQVKPILKEWDQGVNQRFQEIQGQYAPYKQFVEQKVDPQRLTASYQLAERLAQDPVGFYEDLKQSLVARGRIQEAQAVQAQQDAAAAQDTDGDDDPYVQKLTALERQIQERDQALAQYFEQTQQAQVEQQLLEQENANIEAGFQQVESKIGPMSDPLKAMVIEKAMIMNQQLGRAVSIPEAANEVLKALNAARRTTAAPRGIPAGGSVPQSLSKDPAEMTRQERFAAADQIRRRYQDS